MIPFLKNIILSSFLLHKKVSYSCGVMLLIFVIHLIFINNTNAATYYSRATGNWTTNTTWSLSSGGGAVGVGVYPIAGDIVNIERGFTVTVNANSACASISFTNIVRASSTLTISGTNSLAVSGLITMIRPAAGFVHTINVNAGTLTAGSLTMSATITTRNNIINISTGTFTINGATTTGTTGCQFIFSGAGTLEFGGTFTSTPTITTFTGSTVIYSRAGVQTVRGTTYSNLTLNGSGTKTLGAATITNGTLTVNSGITLSMSTFLLTLNGDLINNGGTVSGTTGGVTIAGTATQNIGAFTTTGTVSMTKTGGTATLTGNANGAAFTINGTGGTLNLGSGLTHTFSGAWTRTAGTLNGGSSLLKIGGSVSGAGGTFTANTGTVEWNAAGIQTLAGVIYNNLTLSGSGAKTTTGATVNGIISLEGTATTAGTIATYGASTTLQYKGSASQTTGIEFPATFNGTGGVIINNTNGVILGAAKSIGATSSLALTNGNLTTTAINLLSITNTATTAISGGSTSSFINGPVKWTLPASLASGSTYNFPIGSGATYLPFSLVNPTTGTGVVTAQIQAIVGSTGGGFDATLSSISTSEYWSLVTAGNFTNSSASLTRPTAITPNDALGGSTTLAGTYTSLAGSASTYGVSNSNTIGTNRFFVLAKKPVTLYSYQSGTWATASTWTTDPSGSTLVGSAVPVTNDIVVILNGRAVTLGTSVATTGLTITINAGGTIDMVTYAFSSTITSLSGDGLLRLKSASFPTVTSNNFVTSSGGTVEYYDVSITLPTQTIYNNLKITNSTGSNYTFILQNPTNPTNYTINGSLTLEKTSTGTVTFTLGNAARVINLTVNGNISVGIGCTVNVGAFNAIHAITLYGDLTNNGTIRLTNQASPVSTAYYTAAVTTGGAASLTFTGATNNTLTCNGVTDFYYLIINKGTDQTYLLTVNSSSTSNFALYGPNNSATNSAKALYIQNGTLKLNSNINIPSLTEGGIDYNILTTAALWINGATVMGTVVGLNGTGYQGLTILGKLRISAGSISSGDAAGLVYWATAAPEILIEGGTLDVSQIWFASGSGIFTYTQTGGTLNIRQNGESHAGAMIQIPTSSSVFNMSGGTINFINGIFSAGQGIDIQCAEGNYNITGGTVNINLPSGTNFGINTTVPFYNLTLSRQSGGATTTATLLNTSSSTIKILNDLTVNDNTLLDAGTNSVNLTLQHDYSISTNGTYTPGSTTTTFNGTSDQLFTINGTITSGLNNFTIDKTSGTLTLAGSATTLTVNGTLSLLNGTLADGGITISSKGNIVNSATHTGAGKIALTGTAVQSISGSGSGVFQNLELNNTNAAAAPVSLSANQTINGILTLTSSKIFNINTYTLSLGASASISGASASKFISTAGNASDGGLKKTFSSTSFTFPIGTATDYTPATITLSTSPSAYGSITIRPVIIEHPNITTSGRSLSYYWKTSSTGFTLGSATVSQTYTYVASDVVSGGDVSEAEYVPARYNSSTFSWGSTTSADINTGTKVITFQSATFNTIIDGDYTAGDNNPTNPFGGVVIYYSRNIGGGPYNWSNANSWSTAGIDGAAASSAPTSSSPVKIGDVTHNHSIIVDANTKLSGSLEIFSGSVLDIAATTGHNFGTISGTGKIRLSSATLPSGDLGTFVTTNGGTIEFYRNASNFTLPSSQTTYNNLLITTTGGVTGTITFPAGNLTINNNLTIGASDNAASLIVNTDATGSRTINITGNLTLVGISGANTTLCSLVSGNNQAINVSGNITIEQYSTFGVPASGAAQTHTLSIGSTTSGSGNLTNNGTFAMYSNSGGLRVCNVTFAGNQNAAVTGTGGTTDFNILTVNKGSSQSAILNVNASNFTLSGALPALVLTNGTFRLTSSQTLGLATTSSFTVPSTTCLSVNGGTINIGTTNDAGDLLLAGKIEVLAGTMNIGNSANNNNNDIEYSASGYPEINVQGGTLYVNGQIRRNLSNTLGSLVFNQSGTGNITIGTRNIQVTRAAFEVTNSGSTFNMSGTGILTIERCGGTTYGDIYLSPTTSSVTGGSVMIGSTNTPAAQTFIINSTASVYNLTIDATTQTKTVQLNTNGLSINNNLTISGNSVFNANSLNVSIGGNLTNNNTDGTTGVTVGGYRTGATSQITTFNSSTSNQLITGVGTNLTNFGKLVINNTYTSGAVTLQSNSNIRVNDELTISSGTLSDGGLIISVVGNIVNSATHTSTGSGKIDMIGSSQQTISGVGVFGNLNINNTSNVVFSSNNTINGTLTLTSGLFNIGSYILTLGSNASVSGTFSSTRMIQTNGTISDGGVKKYFDGSLTGATFLYPIGVSGKYTPVNYTITTGTTGGYSTIKPINSKHPNATGAGADYITFYWNVVHSITNLTSLTHTYTYIQSDVAGTESNFRDASFYSSVWNVGSSGGNPNTTTNIISFTNTASGDYTAGIATAFANPGTYTSNVASGNWETAGSWTPGGPPPSGANVIIQNGHTITITANTKTTNSLTINSTGMLNIGNYTDLNFGTVLGIGTIKINPNASNYFVFPAGDFTSFTASSGGTIEFNNTTNATLPSQSTYNNITFTGAAIKYIPNSNYILNGNILFSAGTVDNTSYNKDLNIAGNWTANTASPFSGGTGTVTFDGTTQSINGANSTTFGNLVIGGTGTKSLSISTSINNNCALTINNGATLDAATYQLNFGTSGVANINGTLQTTNTNGFNGSTLTTINSTNTPTINHGTNSLVEYNTTGSQTISSSTYKNITVNNSGTKTLGGNIIINGALTINTATLDVSAVNNYSITLGGNFINSGIFNQNSGIVTFNGSTTLSGSSTTTFHHVIVSNTLTGVLGGNFNVEGNWTNNGTYNGNGGTITFTGTSTITGSIDASFNNIVISSTLNGKSAANFNVSGDWTNNGTFNHNNGTITFNGITSMLGSVTSTNFNNIIVSGILTAPSLGNIGIAGNWTNNGTFTHNNSNIIFNGASCQYGGSATTTFYNVEIPVFANLTVPATKTLNATNFIIRSSTMSNSGNLVVQGDGVVSVSGNSICERYLSYPGDAKPWHYVSSPCAAAGQAFNFDGFYLRAFLPATNAYNSLTKTSDMTAGRGYTAKKTTAVATTINFTGAFNSGDISYPLETGGASNFNIVGNPYPSTIDIDAAGWGSTWTDNISGKTMHFWNGTGYITWQQGGVGTRADGLIASGEAGFVEALGGSWTPSNSVRVTNTSFISQGMAMYKKRGEKSSRPNMLRVFATDSTYSDQALIVFREDGALNEYDTRWDAYKMYGNTNVPQISSFPLNDTLSQLAINSFDSLSLIEGGLTIPVAFTCNRAGKFILSSGNTESFDTSIVILLEDKTTNKIINFRTSSYSFSTTAASKNDKRFLIHFNPVETSIKQNNTNTIINLYLDNNILNISAKDNSQLTGIIEIFDITGRKLNDYKLNQQSNYQIDIKELPSSAYIVRYSNNNQCISKKIIK